MSLKIANDLTAGRLAPKLSRVFEFSAGKILATEKSWDGSQGAPVFTVKGRYTSRGWTEWTQGFQFGSALLQFDATGEKRFLEIGRRKTQEVMAAHVSHIGVHDHGFNNLSTYGNLWRLMREGRIPFNEGELQAWELALKVSGAIQAARWADTAEGLGYIYSFNGPHSLFVDTLRSLRSLAVAHQLGHALMGERDLHISLLRRLLAHGECTARYNVYYGEGRDAYDVCGRTAQESIFNPNDGHYRCPSSQQGYSPFTTWMRGLGWALLGFAEQLEFLDTLPPEELRAPAAERRGKGPRPAAGRRSAGEWFHAAAVATADYYLANCCADGIPMWDSGAPDLWRIGAAGGGRGRQGRAAGDEPGALPECLERASDPFNPWEPVDSSAAAIAAQGLIRLGNHLAGKGEAASGKRYRQAGLTIAATLFQEPYLSSDAGHHGLMLHSVYHRPNRWDRIPPGQKVPNGESSMWGDYHARELALLLLREAGREKYPVFFKQP